MQAQWIEAPLTLGAICGAILEGRVAADRCGDAYIISAAALRRLGRDSTGGAARALVDLRPRRALEARRRA